ncbi:hypothetical protein [Microtetraspora glauca]|uniref:Uncharacterized protein n=1 Tax=Microtetraspora glauca TaxID=1996 RepID=A0ABV3GLK7_MICGL
MDNRTLHPRRGPHNPLRTPSTRLPGSVRRTATLDTLRPEGLTGRCTCAAPPATS